MHQCGNVWQHHKGVVPQRGEVGIAHREDLEIVSERGVPQQAAIFALCRLKDEERRPASREKLLYRGGLSRACQASNENVFSDVLFFPGLQGRLRQIVLNQERGRCERQAWRITAQLSRFASGGSGQGRSAPPPQRFNPLVQHLAVPLQLRCHPAAQLDLPLI